ncbi:MAG: hypothetical protein MMC23_008556 [Stictis urceolatum]|nr:hypothetical protein [Stictis urceolata]
MAEAKSSALEAKPEITEAERSGWNDVTEKEHVNFDRVDAEIATYAGGEAVEIGQKESRRLKTMIDRRVLVIMILTYFLQAIDKGTMSFTSIMGILDEAHISKAQFPWLTTCIYLAVLVVEYPTNRIIQRVPVAKYLGANIMIWGSILALHAACSSFAGLVAVRTLLGVFEACCQPAFLILSSMWYRREERTGIVAYRYMMNGAQQIVGGLVAYCFTLIGSDRAIKSWQAIFIAYGCISVFWGGFVLWWMPDSPMRAKCFSEEDKRLMIERVRDNQTGLQNKTFRREQMIEGTFAIRRCGAFANIIIRSFDFTALQTQLLAMVSGFYIIVVLFTSTWLVKKTGQSLLVMLAFCVPSFVGTIFLMTLDPTTFSLRVGMLISYYITLSFWSAQTLSMSMISQNIAGQTKKTTVVAANFISWALGNAIGPQVFLGYDAPRYFIAFATHLGYYGLLVLTVLFLRWWLIKENKRKDRLKDEGRREADQSVAKVHAFEDLTDRENLGFRYAV